MKKVYYFVISIITTIILFNVNLVIFALLKSSNVEEINNPVINTVSQRDYTNEFLEKTNYFSFNSLGSCGYQAINIMLNYYDSYWNDSIIAECYEKQGCINDNLEILNSPGSKYDDIYDEDVNSSFDYYNKLSTDNIMKKLIDIGVIKEYTTLSSYSKYDFGLYANQIFDILKTYINKYTDISGLFYFYEKYYESGVIEQFSANARKLIIEYVQKGIPVLVTAQNSTSGHAFIAYDYDNESDTVYAHYGYKNSYKHRNYELDYPCITGICTTVPKSNKTHEHCNNFVYSNTNYCSCKLESHVHDYIYTYKSSNHLKSCYCGKSFSENHIVDKNQNCIYCKTYINPNDKYHVLINLGDSL